MTSTTSEVRPTATRQRRGLTVVAAIGFVVSWVVGLSVFSASTDVQSTGAQIVAGYHGHTGLATAQFLLTEGAASVCLALVAWAVGRAGSRVVLATGLAAAGIALVQCALGVYLTGSVAPASDASTAETVLGAINRLDGVKMLLLAAMAVGGYAFGRRTNLLPKWLGYVAIALAIALVASGIGYALLVSSLALAAWVSLPLLLVWVAGAGLSLRRPAV